jgi:hemoglobin-like flavoprotein
VGYGVEEPHYAVVGEALIGTLEQGLGAAFGPPVRTAWIEVYAFIAGTMIEAARAAGATPKAAAA